MRTFLPAAALVMCGASSTAAWAQDSTGAPASPSDPTRRIFQLVLPPGHLLGDWGGARTRMVDAGITPNVTVVTDLAGNSSGGVSQGVTAPTSVELSLFIDLEKTTGIKGGSIFISTSERRGKSLSKEHVGNVFSVQQIYGFQTWRLIDFSYQQQLLDDKVELRLGRFAATDDFMVSTYSCGLVSNAFCGNPFGILLDAPGISAYTGAWGALLKLKPSTRSYVQAGIYNGDANVREDRHHGLDFSMHGPAFGMVEAGYQVNGQPGDSDYLGNYKAGVWYDANALTEFETGKSVGGSWGFYGMFDQVVAPFGAPGCSCGVGVFGSLTVASDPGRQQLAEFVTAGISMRGFRASRPRDGMTLGLASGRFSSDLRDAQRNGQLPGPVGGQRRESLIEATYRFDLKNGSIFIQPDLQYILHPSGTNRIDNPVVLGVQLGVNL